MLIPKALFKVATLLLLLIANYFVSLEAFELYPNTSHVNVVRCIDKEQQALIKFKDSLEDLGGILSSWFGSDCCTWKGVGCRYPTGEVLNLDLSFMFLGGKLSHYLDELEHLSYLNLSYNSFSGMIPPQLGNLSNLRVLDLHSVGYLDIYVSDLKWISGLSSLKFLDLTNINLSLATTHWLQAINNIPSLVELHLVNTQLQSVPLFLSRSNLTSLSVLDLSYNNFSTQAPQWLINISTGVVVLRLSECYFRGPISSLFGGSLFRYNHNYKLEELYLFGNEFSGELPDSFGHLKSLRTLDLNSNSISGPLPTSIGRLSKLEILRLGNNKMNGSIPKSLGSLGELKILELSHNEWEGILSQDHFEGLSKLKELYISPRNGALHLNNLSRNWVPPFSLEVIWIKDQEIGPEFPAWLQTQTQLVDIVLSNVSISDTIPSWLWKLSPRIQQLDLSHNQLRGTIPTSLVFPSYTSTFIDLSSNFLHGRLPLWQNVLSLFLDNNTFSRPIPVKIGQIMSSLRNLHLSGNSLNGSIPSSLGKMNDLYSLSLANNQLSGKVHDNWMNNLMIIDLSNNNLSGEFPASLCSSPELLELKLSNNKLFGKLPSSVKNSKNLFLLDLGENKFSGSIPKWIVENHLWLQHLRMRGNLFNESIIEQFCGLQSLHVLDLAQNNFSGPIPTCLSQLNGMNSTYNTMNYSGVNMDLNLKGIQYTYDVRILSFVRLIDLSSNNLTGFLPEGITNLAGLGTLNLSNNHLTGKIPSRIGEMQNLETLDLSSNHFYGQIPPSMSYMTFLAHLNLSHNNLSGRIPSGNQFSTFDESVYEGNSGLCGSPLPKCGPLVVQEEGGNDDDEDGDEKDDGKLGLFVSVALGFIFGFWSICGSLVIKKSWRDAYYGLLDKTKDWIMMVVALNLNRLRRMIARMGS